MTMKRQKDNSVTRDIRTVFFKVAVSLPKACIPPLKPLHVDLGRWSIKTTRWNRDLAYTFIDLA